MPETQVMRCVHCRTANRVPRDKIQQGLQPVCGQCHRPLPVLSKPLMVTDATFASEVERSPLPVLLDLWAPWCGPCRLMAPMLDELAAEMAGRVRVAKLNVDENPVTAGRFNVRSIPTLLALKNGVEVDRIVGLQSKSDIARRLQHVIT